MQSTRESSCRATLRALLEARLADFTGLGGCTAADCEAVLGPSVAGPALADAWGAARLHPASQVAPNGVEVWLSGDSVIALEVVAPRLGKSLVAARGEPEGRLKSELCSDWQQWIYCSRGLTFHVSRIDGEIKTLYGYPPMTLSEFTQSGIAHVRTEEIPLE